MEIYIASVLISLLLIVVALILDIPHNRHLSSVGSAGANVNDLASGNIRLPNNLNKGRRFAFPLFQNRLQILGELTSDLTTEALYEYLAANRAKRLSGSSMHGVKIHIARGRFVVETGPSPGDSGGEWALGKTVPVLAIDFVQTDSDTPGNMLHLIVVVHEIGNRQIFSLDTFPRQTKFHEGLLLVHFIVLLIPAVNILFTAACLLAGLKYFWFTVGPFSKSIVSGEASKIRFNFGEQGFEGLRQVAMTISHDIQEAVGAL